ncbi:MAG TPA: isoprenylcysteine carboxylmethyltransferase family protein [Anaerolineae bacterium]|nr:isoprenylcysteine carboxylmethyltransferase family protein [Anaerolineae bacterium]
MRTNITQPQLDTKPGITRRAIQVFATIAFLAAMLFLPSGRLDWVWAWVLIGLYLLGILANFVLLMRFSPATIAERAEARGMKAWDKIVGGLWSLMYFVATPVVAGLDARFGWTGSYPLALHVLGALAFALGLALFSWAMISNAFFATVVRIQTDRGHTVCTTGPYRFVRHPGYVGGIVQSLAVPLLLGSPWALVPGGLAALLMIIRTALEDRTLREELPGYVDYAQRTRYRLVPGVW